MSLHGPVTAVAKGSLLDHPDPWRDRLAGRAERQGASYGYVMDQGKVVLDGTADELRDNEDVKEFYLGGAGERRKL
jgi:hypothetical protein